MIPALILLLASVGSLPLLEETIEVPPGQWRSFEVQLEQSPAVIQCRHTVLSGGSGVRVELMRHSDRERLRQGLRHHILAATGYDKSGGFRWGPGPLGAYSIVVDNRLEGRGPARVRVAVSLLFFEGKAGELSSARRVVVILITLAVMTVIIGFAVRKLGGALLGRR